MAQAAASPGPRDARGQPSARAERRWMILVVVAVAQLMVVLDSTIVLSYPWTHFICGHLGRLATRDDVALHQRYIADIEASSREALASVNPVPYYMRYGENVWAGVQGHLDAVTERAAAPVIAKYTGVR